MNKILVALFAAAALVLGVVVLRQQQRISSLEQVAQNVDARNEAPVVETKPAAAEPVKVAVAPVEPVEKPAEAHAPEPVTPPTPVAAARATPEGKKPNMGDFLKNIGSMMTNDAMKGMIRAQAKMQLDHQYGRLFAYLNKSPETIEALKNLLMDRQMALMDNGLAFMNGNLSAEERKQKADELKATKEGFDSKIAALLGADDYDAFKQYEDTQPERMQVEMAKMSISGSGEPLTEQQEYDLVNAMHQARTNSATMSALMNPNAAPDPAQFSGEGMKKMVESMDQMQKAYAAAAQKILTPAQYAAYEKHQEQQKQMNEIGLKFAAQMFGGDTNATPPNVQVQVQTITAP